MRPIAHRFFGCGDSCARMCGVPKGDATHRGRAPRFTHDFRGSHRFPITHVDAHTTFNPSATGTDGARVGGCIGERPFGRGERHRTSQLDRENARPAHIGHGINKASFADSRAARSQSAGETTEITFLNKSERVS